MKKVPFILTALLFIAMTSPSGATTIRSTSSMNKVVADIPPAAVLTSFNTLFGNAPVSQWKLRSNGNWRAHFMNNGIAWEATFTATGVLVKSEPK